MSRRAAPMWTCPWCQRLVPARETRCHCGCDRAVAEAKDAAEAQEASSGGRVFLLMGGLLVAVALLVYAALRPRDHRVLQAFTPVASPLPPRSAPSFGPPPAYGDIRTGGGGYAPVPVWASPSTPVETPAAPVLPMVAGAKPEPSPSTSSMEDEWEKAAALLEPRLAQIAQDSGALQSRYHTFASLCLAPGSGSGSWLTSLKNANVVGNVQFTDHGEVFDCSALRSQLQTRASGVKSQFSAAEELARTSRVLPGHWRKLVESHQLDEWQSY